MGPVLNDHPDIIPVLRQGEEVYVRESGVDTLRRMYFYRNGVQCWLSSERLVPGQTFPPEYTAKHLRQQNGAAIMVVKEMVDLVESGIYKIE